jgi:hypothetical protein
MDQSIAVGTDQFAVCSVPQSVEYDGAHRIFQEPNRTIAKTEIGPARVETRISSTKALDSLASLLGGFIIFRGHR